MSEFVQVQGVNFEELKQALRECPQTAFQFVGRKMGLEGNRFRKRFIAARMHGRPGLAWGGSKSVGGNVKARVSGRTLQDLRLVIKLSSFLAVHETGKTIRPTKGAWLYIRQRVSSGRSTMRLHRAARLRLGLNVTHTFQVVARVRQVTIPARLGFRAMFNRETPAILATLEGELGRAIRVAFERRVKSLTGAIRRAVA